MAYSLGVHEIQIRYSTIIFLFTGVLTCGLKIFLGIWGYAFEVTHLRLRIWGYAFEAVQLRFVYTLNHDLTHARGIVVRTHTDIKSRAI